MISGRTTHNLNHPINHDLLFNIAKVESNHKDKTISNKGAWGRHQIRHAVWEKELKKNKIIKNKYDLFKKKENTLAAYFILIKYHKQYNGDMRITLAKYSGGAKNYYEKVME